MNPEKRVRVLVVDDSVVVRQVVSELLRAAPGIELIGTAENGKVALQKIDQLRPDLITLDLEMPELDGFGVLQALRGKPYRPKVIVFSTLTERGASATLDALARGADDYVCKPSGQKSLGATMEKIKVELLPKVYGLGRYAAASPPPAAPRNVSRLEPSGAVDVIVIGSSTGGPTALSEMFAKLDRGLHPPILVAQHMPPVFTRVLGERISEKGPLIAAEAAHGEPLVGGRIYIAPGDFHLQIGRGARGMILETNQAARENGCRPSADVLFKSAAAKYGAGVLAIVLTGLGSDGTRGAEAVRAAGGRVWVQDQKTSAAWGMPGSVVDAGFADRVLPLSSIAGAINEAVRAASLRPTHQGTARVGKSHG